MSLENQKFIQEPMMGRTSSIIAKCNSKVIYRQVDGLIRQCDEYSTIV